jgi:hypothetical protein
MELAEFGLGKTYEAKRRDFEPPDGSPTILGEWIRFTVLEPASADNHKAIGGAIATPAHVKGWSEFLRVRNHNKDIVHLLHPATIVSAVELF